MYKGIGVSSGIIEGTVKVLLCDEDITKVEDNDIIVVYASSPIWAIPLMKASALISERGGVLCHTAIIAREIGIPCVVGIDNITKELHDGDRIRINGKDGTVDVLR